MDQEPAIDLDFLHTKPPKTPLALKLLYIFLTLAVIYFCGLNAYWLMTGSTPNSPPPAFEDPALVALQYNRSYDREELIHPDEPNRQTVSVDFYLFNWPFFSRKIFNLLTDQQEVTLHSIDYKNSQFYFATSTSMRRDELYSIVSERSPDEPEALVAAGETVAVAFNDVVEIPRTKKINHVYTDHLGVTRTVSIELDLMKFDVTHGSFITLDDGTVLASENGPLIVEERHAAKEHFRGIPTDVERQFYLYELNGDLFRIVKPDLVLDKHGQQINDPNDPAVIMRHSYFEELQIPKLLENLDYYTRATPEIEQVARTISGFYDNEADAMQGTLCFVQSFKYKRGMIRGYNKTPKNYWISGEGDCREASIMAVAIWTAQGYDAGLMVWENKTPGQDGHAIPVIAAEEHFSGSHELHDGRQYLHTESTHPGWRIGDASIDQGVFKKGYLQLHGASPINL